MAEFFFRLKNCFVFALLFLLISNDFSLAQFFFFGRNKVQYQEFDWKILRTEHFDIYYYDEMGKIAEIGAFYAEEIYDELKVRMNHIVTRKVPLIFYNTTIDFQQTNTTPGLIPEGVGGFFEFLKGRVVLPSNGSLYDFRHVIRHELVHVFMTNKVYRVLKDHRIPTNRMPPLWFVEGLAEFYSTEWDAQAEMLLRDAVLNNYFVSLKDMNRIYGSYLMYKEGQSFLEFAADKYGEEKIALLLDNFWMYTSFNQVLETTFKESFEQIDNEWLYFLRKKYYPMMDSKYPTEFGSKKITEDGFNFAPVYFEFESRKYLYFVANRDGYSSLYRIEISPEFIPLNSPELVLRGGQTQELESFHLFNSSIDISEDGLLVLVTKRGGSDAIHFFSIIENAIIKTFQTKELVFISSPKFSLNGNRIVFSAVDRKGFSDIFLFDLLSDELYRVTNDYYDDKDPVFGTNEQQIIFSSDRTAGDYEKKYNLFSGNLNDHSIEYITYLNANCFTPVLSPDKKKLLFTSELDGVRNLYDLPIEQNEFGKEIKQISNFISSAYNPSYIDSANIAISGFENLSFDLFVLNNSRERSDSLTSIQMIKEPAPGMWNANVIELPSERKKVDYEKEYSLDFAQSVVATDPVFGTRGGAVLSISDLLGDDRYSFLIYNSASVQSDILKSFNVILQKVNFASRVNYGYGIFHLSGRVYDFTDPDEFFYERSFGGSFLLSYPISKFQRLEATATVRSSNKEVIPNVIERKAMLFTNTLGWVMDNSIWGPTGPIDGIRAVVLLGYTSDIKFSNVNYFTLIGDYRYYYRFGLTTLLAFRAAAFYNQGKEARRFFVGGSWDLRGWPRFGIRGEKVWLTSLEFRFPIIEQIAIKFPFFALGFWGIRGAIFYDMGSAWDEKYTTTLGSLGFGFRMNLFGVLTLRYDIGKKIEKDFTEFQKGLFYQFFFGWDF
ncbi:MAG: BamA/TamA family outer membrane protein [Ignavibacteria bacterium]|nr:BamA/TamA family outer membrane protein [Ignavibacteria bacterium]MBT8382673.1 BamA/TamA family outer membrane protein [Ignavibacteria bacterium]MBT8391744.1 BamA/TamA family outer membrane protein [Ignavibacteria bacterium]NNJ51582.1 BamA/TamA family outer membrane protein [Ignavibacteriaceae bacterium]NNL20320.1 BamA/TamA family outer membrane protein [Ignavibacteriaceae bacterium]